MNEMPTTILSTRGMTVRYGKAAAVRDVSLDLREGEVVTIVGPNGAGKTTLLAALMGLLPFEGEASWFGGRLNRRPEVETLVRAGVALIPETRELFGSMPVEDNLRLGAFHRRGASVISDSLSDVFALFPRLLERRRQIASTLSGGERQMLAMGRALMADPRVLMLDEPSLGLAPRIVREVFATIENLRLRGVSILLVEQNARAALQIADRAYVMESGAIVLSGAAKDLANDPRVIESYFGMPAAEPPTRLSR